LAGFSFFKTLRPSSVLLRLLYFSDSFRIPVKKALSLSPPVFHERRPSRTGISLFSSSCGFSILFFFGRARSLFTVSSRLVPDHSSLESESLRSVLIGALTVHVSLGLFPRRLSSLFPALRRRATFLLPSHPPCNPGTCSSQSFPAHRPKRAVSFSFFLAPLPSF